MSDDFSMSINIHNPDVMHMDTLSGGAQVIHVGGYPGRVAVFFHDHDAVLDFVSRILKESGVNYYTWERVEHIEETVSVPFDLALSYN